MDWVPVSGNHAIERVRVVFGFSTPLSPKMKSKLAEIIERRRGDFEFGPMTQVESQALAVNVRPGVQMRPAPAPTTTTGWLFQRKGANDVPVEGVICDGISIIYETAEYGRWATFKKRFDDILGDVLQGALMSFDVGAMAIEYHDRFVHTGANGRADARQVFVDLSAVLSARAAAPGELWHLHRGWYEDFEGRKLLINQNFDAQEGEFSGRSAQSVQVFTKAELRSGFGPIDAENIDHYLESMHARANEVLGSHLTADARASIGLG